MDAHMNTGERSLPLALLGWGFGGFLLAGLGANRAAQVGIIVVALLVGSFMTIERNRLVRFHDQQYRVLEQQLDRERKGTLG
jgi:hypothetical protein